MVRIHNHYTGDERTAAEIKKDIREVKAEMKQLGVGRRSVFNAGHDPDSYRLNGRLFALNTELDRVGQQDAAVDLSLGQLTSSEMSRFQGLARKDQSRVIELLAKIRQWKDRDPVRAETYQTELNELAGDTDDAGFDPNIAAARSRLGLVSDSDLKRMLARMERELAAGKGSSFKRRDDEAMIAAIKEELASRNTDDASYHHREGEKAKQEGKSEEDNPYPKRSEAAREWREGYQGRAMDPYYSLSYRRSPEMHVGNDATPSMTLGAVVENKLGKGFSPWDYDAGIGAFRRGKALSDNPHPAGTNAHKNWEQGYKSGQAGTDDDQSSSIGEAFLKLAHHIAGKKASENENKDAKGELEANPGETELTPIPPRHTKWSRKQAVNRREEEIAEAARVGTSMRTKGDVVVHKSPSDFVEETDRNDDDAVQHDCGKDCACDKCRAAHDAIKTVKGVYYFPSYNEAKNWAQSNGWPTDRIVEYGHGHAVQSGKSGNYAGPGESPREWKGVSDEARDAAVRKALDDGQPTMTRQQANYVPRAGRNRGARFCADCDMYRATTDGCRLVIANYISPQGNCDFYSRKDMCSTK